MHVLTLANFFCDDLFAYFGWSYDSFIKHLVDQTKFVKHYRRSVLAKECPKWYVVAGHFLTSILWKHSWVVKQMIRNRARLSIAANHKDVLDRVTKLANLCCHVLIRMMQHYIWTYSQSSFIVWKVLWMCLKRHLFKKLLKLNQVVRGEDVPSMQSCLYFTKEHVTLLRIIQVP